MQRNFLQLREFLAMHHPKYFGGGANIYGETYPIPYYAAILLNLVQLSQLFCLAAAFFGERLFTLIPFVSGPPAWYYSARENPMLVLTLVFFIFPTFVNAMVVSGAFEVYFDGTLIYSKLQTGRMPSGKEILDALEMAGLRQGV